MKQIGLKAGNSGDGACLREGVAPSSYGASKDKTDRVSFQKIIDD